MATRDWALVIFTLLTQAAVGAFLTLQALHFLAVRRGDDPPAAGAPVDDPAANERGTGSRDPGRAAGGRRPGSAATGSGGALAAHAAILAVLSAGLLAALFHLSTPLQAARAVVNFSSSWLSREIVFGSLFAILLAAIVATELRPEGASRSSRWLPLAAAAAGVAFLLCQIAIYLLPAQPAWNSLATPAAFGGSALRLGILGVAVGLAATGPLPEEEGRVAATGSRTWQTLRALALAAIVALAAELIVVPLHLLSLAADGSAAAAASAERLTGNYGGVLVLRIGSLCVATAALVGVVAGNRLPAGPRLARPLIGAAFCIVLVSELCGRFLFYAMQVRVGI